MWLIAVYSCGIGLLNLCGGASPDSRFYRADDFAVRLLGIALLVLGALLAFRPIWTIVPLAVVYLLSIIEVIITARSPSPVIGAILFFGVPLGFLIRVGA